MLLTGRSFGWEVFSRQIDAGGRHPFIPSTLGEGSTLLSEWDTPGRRVAVLACHYMAPATVTGFDLNSDRLLTKAAATAMLLPAAIREFPDSAEAGEKDFPLWYCRAAFQKGREKALEDLRG